MSSTTATFIEQRGRLFVASSEGTTRRDQYGEKAAHGGADYLRAEAVCEGIPLSRSLQVRTPRAIFNVLNNAGVVAQNWQTGATTFGRITTLEAPRVARLGAERTF
jgi:triphosphoribosyl-dephospho-CoA synthetase